MPTFLMDEVTSNKARNRDSAILLRYFMQELSERYYCAGWRVGLEYDLWALVCGGIRAMGLEEPNEAEIIELRRLSEAAGGWWKWDAERGTIFLTLEEWGAHWIVSNGGANRGNAKA